MRDQKQRPFDSPLTNLFDDYAQRANSNPTQHVASILLYTDIDTINDDPPDVYGYESPIGLYRMKAQLTAHESTFLKFRVKVLNRNQGSVHASHRISTDLLSGYEEVWLFGRHQIKRTGKPFDRVLGGPESELRADELDALTDWMKLGSGVGGGVLVTGDHSERHPDGRLNDPHDSYLGLGAAIAKDVTRAGQLRDWNGPPTDDGSTDTINSVAPGDTSSEKDATPQPLDLVLLDGNWKPDSRGQYHPVFLRWRENQLDYIRIFPDHFHEGLVKLPDDLTTSAWPHSHRAAPVVIARGINYGKFPMRSFPVLASYDGDPVNLGRIVADSSWRHYMNDNLRGFTGSPAALEALDQIGQYYFNLAFWLLPRERRELIVLEVLFWLISHDNVRQEIATNPLNVGIIAGRELTQRVPACMFSELLRMILPPSWRKHLAEISKFGGTISPRPLPSVELILGTLIQEIDRARSPNHDRADSEPETLTELAFMSAKKAWKMHLGALEDTAGTSAKSYSPSHDITD